MCLHKSFEFLIKEGYHCLMAPGNVSLVPQESVGEALSLTQLLLSRDSVVVLRGCGGITRKRVAHWSRVPLLPWAEEGLRLNWFPVCVGKLGPHLFSCCPRIVKVDGRVG